MKFFCALTRDSAHSAYAIKTEKPSKSRRKASETLTDWEASSKSIRLREPSKRGKLEDVRIALWFVNANFLPDSLVWEMNHRSRDDGYYSWVQHYVSFKEVLFHTAIDTGLLAALWTTNAEAISVCLRFLVYDHSQIIMPGIPSPDPCAFETLFWIRTSDCDSPCLSCSTLKASLLLVEKFLSLNVFPQNR